MSFKWKLIVAIAALGIGLCVASIPDWICLKKDPKDITELWDADYSDIKVGDHVCMDVTLVWDQIGSQISQEKTFGVTTSEKETGRYYLFPFCQDIEGGLIYPTPYLMARIPTKYNSVLDTQISKTQSWWESDGDFDSVPTSSIHLDGKIQKIPGDVRKQLVASLDSGEVLEDYMLPVLFVPILVPEAVQPAAIAGILLVMVSLVAVFLMLRGAAGSKPTPLYGGAPKTPNYGGAAPSGTGFAGSQANTAGNMGSAFAGSQAGTTGSAFAGGQAGTTGAAFAGPQQGMSAGTGFAGSQTNPGSIGFAGSQAAPGGPTTASGTGFAGGQMNTAGNMGSAFAGGQSAPAGSAFSGTQPGMSGSGSAGLQPGAVSSAFVGAASAFAGNQTAPMGTGFAGSQTAQPAAPKAQPNPYSTATLETTQIPYIPGISVGPAPGSEPLGPSSLSGPAQNGPAPAAAPAQSGPSAVSGPSSILGSGPSAVSGPSSILGSAPLGPSSSQGPQPLGPSSVLDGSQSENTSILGNTPAPAVSPLTSSVQESPAAAPAADNTQEKKDAQGYTEEEAAQLRAMAFATSQPAVLPLGGGGENVHAASQPATLPLGVSPTTVSNHNFDIPVPQAESEESAAPTQQSPMGASPLYGAGPAQQPQSAAPTQQSPMGASPLYGTGPAQQPQSAAPTQSPMGASPLYGTAPAAKPAQPAEDDNTPLYADNTEMKNVFKGAFANSNNNNNYN